MKIYDDEGFYLRPDPRHPDFPSWKREKEVVAQLAGVPVFARFITEYAPKAKTATYIIEAYQRQRLKIARDVYLQAIKEMNDIFAAIQDIASEHGPEEILLPTKMRFLVDRCFPDNAKTEWLTKLEPVHLIARPAAIQMFIQGASQRERHAYDTLIDRAQAYLGLRKSKGGRPRIEDDPVMAEQAKTAAKLTWMGYPTGDIAAFFSWEGDDKALETKVSTYIKRGIDLLIDDPVPWVKPFGRMPRRIGVPRRKEIDRLNAS